MADPSLQSQSGSTSTGAAIAVVQGTTKAGSTIVSAVWCKSVATCPSVSDTQGNTYTALTSFTDPSNGRFVRLFYATNIVGGANTVTSASNGSTDSITHSVVELPPIAGMRVEAHASGAGTMPSVSLAGTQANDICVMLENANGGSFVQVADLCGTNADFAKSSVFGDVTTFVGLSSGGTVSISSKTTGAGAAPTNWSAVAVAFKLAIHVSQTQSNQTTATATGTTLTRTYAAAVIQGSCLACQVQCTDVASETFSVSDSVNGSWGAAVQTVDDGTKTTALFLSPNTAVGTPVVTVTYGITALNRGLWIQEVRNAAVSPLDGSAGQSQASPGSGTDAITSGTANNVKGPALCLALSFDDRTVSPVAPAVGTAFIDNGAGWTFAGGNQARLESKRVTSPGTVAGTFTGTSGVAPTTLMVLLDEIGATSINAFVAGPQMPANHTDYRGSSIAIAGLAVAALNLPAAVCGPQMPANHTDYRGVSGPVTAPPAPPAALPPKIYGSAPRYEAYDVTPYYASTFVDAGSAYSPTSAPCISAILLPPNDYGSSRVIVGAAPPVVTLAPVLGSSPQIVSSYGSSFCTQAVPAAQPTSPQQIFGATLQPVSDYGASRFVQGLSSAAAPQTVYGSSPQPPAPYGSAVCISPTVPAQPTSPQSIYGAALKPTSEYGSARAIAGLAPVLTAPATIYGASPLQASYSGVSAPIAGLVPAPTAYPQKIYGSAPQPPSSFFGSTNVVIGLTAAVAAPQQIYGSSPQPPSAFVGASRVIVGLVPAVVPLQTIYTAPGITPPAYGYSAVIPGQVPAPIAPPTIYTAAGITRSSTFDVGISRAVIGLAPAVQLQQVYGSAPQAASSYGASLVVRVPIPAPVVYPQEIYGSAPMQVSYYGGVIVVPGLVPDFAFIKAAKGRILRASTRERFWKGHR